MSVLRWTFCILVALLISSLAGSVYAKTESRKMKALISKEQAIEIARKRVANDQNSMFKKPYVDSVGQQSGTGNWVVKILSSKPEPNVLGQMYLNVTIDKENGTVLSLDSGGGS